MKARLAAVFVVLLLMAAIGVDGREVDDSGELDEHSETLSKVDPEKYSVAKEVRYLLYDANHGEGFNLRRDVYVRVANLVRLLRQAGENFVLVLPPWGGLYHWQRMQTKLPWSEFFDVVSLGQFVPVIEFDDYLKRVNRRKLLDDVIYLQHYAEGWGTEYVRKFDRRPCLGGDRFYKEDPDSGYWMGWFFSYDDVRTRRFACISLQGDSATVRDMILANFTDSTSLLLDRAETFLHEHFGEREYWRARRSMRYSKQIVDAANQFRREHLSSTDEKDGTTLPERWESEKPRRNAKGGPYVAAHWRRRDFLLGRKSDLPSVEGTAKLLLKLAASQKVKKVFLATDAPGEDVDELRRLMGADVELLQFAGQEGRFNDGAIAIVDQLICAHARYFTGSHESTFSFRIHEDRELRGFAPETTFNRMCPDANPTCEQPTKWMIAY